jgi:hypothetical protein
LSLLYFNLYFLDLVGVRHELDLYIPIIKKVRDIGDLRGSVVISLISVEKSIFELCLVPLVFLLKIHYLIC